MMATANATILKTGPGTSIQDLGRLGKAKFGLPISGAMDLRSFHWINHVLKNAEDAAVLEISQPGLQIQFEADSQISIAGASAKIKLNGNEVSNSALILIQPGDILEVGAFMLGARVYLGIKSGFQTPEILDSRSFYEGLTPQNQVLKGSKIPYFSHTDKSHQSLAKARWATGWFQVNTLSAFPGPDFHLLEDSSKQVLLGTDFTISPTSNRMGIQLTELLENKLPELPTNPVYPGTVQLTSGGKLILLTQDAQVTGGYPRILHLTEQSLWVLAQKRPGDSIRFRLV